MSRISIDSDFRDPQVTLWAYRERWAELEASDNPFATVVMAHLHSHATRRRLTQRLAGKLWYFCVRRTATL